jgi:uncharacterized membrane protein (DUF485 family)
MAGFDHGSMEPEQSESASTVSRNARQGLRLFAVYFLFYAGFVIVNAFRPDWMERTPVAGINVAVLYGFALIVGALVMSLVYGWLCQAPVTDEARQGDAA